jgi:hypothetical protein
MVPAVRQFRRWRAFRCLVRLFVLKGGIAMFTILASARIKNASRTIVLFTALLLSPAVPHAACQSMLWQWTGTDSTDAFCLSWRACCVIGDYDGDGTPDLAVGAYLTKVNGTYGGAVYVFSGKTGAVLAKWTGPAGYAIGATLAPAGDLDGDGVPDLFAAAGFSSTFTISGALGAMQALAPTGGWIASPGDIDGDGYRDVVATPAFYGPDTTAYSGKTGQLLWLSSGINGNISAIGDINLDGIDELIVGRPVDIDHLEPDRATVLDGKTGSIIYDYQPPQQLGDDFGYFHSGLGDLNGDGIPDYSITDDAKGKLTIYSGQTGQPFSNWPSGYLECAHHAGDVDGDGIPDILLTKILPTMLVSGRTHQVIYTISPVSGWGDPGYVGDLDSDDCPDWFDIRRSESFFLPGRVRAYSGMPKGGTAVGSGLPNAHGVAPRIGISSVPKAGTNLDINTSRVAPGTQVWLVVGDPAQDDNFPNLGARLEIPLDALLVNPATVIPMTASEVAPGAGSATVTLTLPPGSAGTAFRVQWIAANVMESPAVVTLSRALDIVVQP